MYYASRTGEPDRARLIPGDGKGRGYKYIGQLNGNYFKPKFFKRQSSGVKPNGELIGTMSAKFSRSTRIFTRTITVALATYRESKLDDIVTKNGHQLLNYAKSAQPNENGEYDKNTLRGGMSYLQYDPARIIEQKINELSSTNNLHARTIASLSASIDVSKVKKIHSSDFVISIGAVIKSVDSPKEMEFMDQLVKLALQDQAIPASKYEYLIEVIISTTEQKILDELDFRDKTTYHVDKLIFIYDYTKLLKSHSHKYSRLNSIMRYKFDLPYRRERQVIEKAKNIFDEEIHNYKEQITDITKDAKDYENTVATLEKLKKAMNAIAQILLASRIIDPSEVKAYVELYSNLYKTFYSNFQKRSLVYLDPKLRDALEVFNGVTESYNALVDNHECIAGLQLKKLEDLTPIKEGEGDKREKGAKEAESSHIENLDLATDSLERLKMFQMDNFSSQCSAPPPLMSAQSLYEQAENQHHPQYQLLNQHPHHPQYQLLNQHPHHPQYQLLEQQTEIRQGYHYQTFGSNRLLGRGKIDIGINMDIQAMRKHEATLKLNKLYVDASVILTFINSITEKLDIKDTMILLLNQVNYKIGALKNTIERKPCTDDIEEEIQALSGTMNDIHSTALEVITALDKDHK